uniref:Uncharacterized protein n=1 Tax=viral metagenome TaxID=1070528 RepID=A0A6C0ANT4_9ZZZZ
MGNDLSLSACVEMSDLPAAIYAELTSEDYTVIRTNGSEQSGWRIPTTSHRCASGTVCAEWAGALVSNHAHPWHVHMVFDGEDSQEPANKHACGWRVSDPERRTFWPTRLNGSSAEVTAAREAWWLRLDGLLDSLESYEQKGSKATPESSESSKMRKNTELEAAYVSDEPQRQAVARTLLENPEADTTMIVQMRSRESTMSRCLRNGTLSPIPLSKNIGDLLMGLEAISVHDTNRARRLFDSGCPKAIVMHICQLLTNASLRNLLLTEEEAKLYLEPLAESLN